MKTLQIAAIWLLACGLSQADLTLHNDANSTVTASGTGGLMHLVMKGDPVLSTDVLGFQVAMWIDPDMGTMGTLEFSAVNQPAADYLLQGIGQGFSAILSTQVTSNDRVRVFDVDTTAPFAGANVPANAEFNLAAMTFEASNDALGVFGIYVIDQAMNRTEWTNLSAQEERFAGIPLDSSPVRIGSVTVVPEPSPVVAIGVLLVFVGIGRTGVVQRFVRWKH